MDWLNIELTNRCNKSCHFCGRDRKVQQGDMPLEIVNEIIKQFNGSIIQFNKDGEPLLYYNLWAVGEMCKGKVTNIVTNGKLLLEKKTALLNNFTTITVSVFEDDDEQYEQVMKFKEYIGDNNPKIFIKFLGDYQTNRYDQFPTLRRSIHKPEGDSGYIQSKPPIPEVGVCLDFLYKPSIDWKGYMHMCNRYDPEGKGIIGNTFNTNLKDIWNSDKRKDLLELHKQGRRDEIEFCKGCEYWGVPANG